MTELHWLPSHPEWRQAVKAIPADPDTAWDKAVGLANARLNFVLTNALDETVRRTLPHGPDTLPTKKPDPAGVQDCLRAFGVAAQRALFIGDSSIDVATARNAGVAVWALTHGYNMGEPIAAARPDRVLDGLDAIVEVAA